MELVFLADGSTSVSQKSFNLMRDWVKQFVQNFDISATTTRVGNDSNQPEKQNFSSSNFVKSN